MKEGTGKQETSPYLSRTGRIRILEMGIKENVPFHAFPF